VVRKLHKYERELRENFAQQVKARAEKLGLSNNRLADFSGISRGHLSKVLRGETAPTLDRIAGIAYALKCEPSDLLKRPKR